MNILALHRKWPRRLLITTLILLLVIVFLQWLIPALAIHGAKQWYSEQGEGYELSVEQWEFSPWRGLVSLDNVTFQYGADSSSFSQLRFNIAMLDLPGRNVIIESARFNGFEMTINEKQDNFYFLGLSANNFKTKSDTADTKQAAPEQQDNPDLINAEQAQEKNSPQWHFNIQTIELNNHTLALNHSKIDLAIEIKHIEFKGQNPLQTLNINSDVIVSHLQVPEKKLVLSQPLTIQLEGALTDVLTAPSWQGKLILEQMMLSNPWLPDMGFKQLALSGLALSKEKQSMSTLTLKDAFIADNVFKLASYDINGLTYQNNTLTSGIHEWSGLVSQLVLDKDNQLVQLHQESQKDTQNEDGASSKSDEALVTPESEEAAPVVRFNIEGIQQKKDSASLVTIKNPHVTPNLNLDLSVEHLVINNLNNQKEEIGINLQVKSDEYSSISLDAGITNDDKTSGNIKLTINQFDLVTLNGYVAKALGYYVAQGQLNLDMAVAIEEGKLSGGGEILIINSDWVPEDEAVMSSISKQISMPIETALSLVKDDNNNIKMNIPIKGDIHAPDFGINDLLSQVSQKALTSATLHYIKQAIFPYGLLVNVAEYVGEELFSISLDPITLVNSELNDEQRDYLLKVISLMQKKNALQLRLCAQVSKDVQHDTWYQDALNRANVIKRFLVSEDSTLASRVLVCQPKLSDKTQIRMGF